VVVGIDDGSVVVLDEAAGELLARARTGGPVKSSPAVNGDKVFVGSTDDAVHAFRVEASA
jgi:outer membrane protein assembly factor BamB